MSDKISVVVPVYNCEEYISECIESILGQTYKNIELILVDDGSKDKSGEICDNFAAQETRIKVVHTENRGVSAARNLGISLANGDYIAFSDSDDTMRPDMLEFLLSIIKEHGTDVAVCGYMRCEDGKEIPINGTGKKYIQTKTEAMRCIIEGKLYTGALWTKLFFANVIKGVTVPDGLKINEDVLLCYYGFKNANGAVFADEAKYNYRIRPFSATGTTVGRKRTGDVMFVTRTIYAESFGSEYETFAFVRLVNALIGCYGSNYERKATRKELITLCDRNENKIKALARNSRIKLYMIKYCPHIYMFAYKIYDKIRKPNWDV